MHDLTIHPRENDLVLGTYGRAIWTGDITPLQELSKDVLDKPAYLFDVEAKARYGFGLQGMNYHLFGDKYLVVPNEPEALVVNCYLKADAPAAAKIALKNPSGAVLRELECPAKAGLNRALINLAGGGGRGGPGGGAGGGPSTGAGQGRGRGGATPAAPLPIGDYTVTVEVAGQSMTKPARVRARM